MTAEHETIAHCLEWLGRPQPAARTGEAGLVGANLAGGSGAPGGRGRGRGRALQVRGQRRGPQRREQGGHVPLRRRLVLLLLLQLRLEAEPRRPRRREGPPQHRPLGGAHPERTPVPAPVQTGGGEFWVFSLRAGSRE